MTRAWLLVGALLPNGLLSQQPARAEPGDSIGPACAGVGFRQFDFWIGRWEVRTTDGQLAGTNIVRRALGGCAIEELWHGEATTGRSLNFYHPATGQWHQAWVDDQAGFLLLRGRFVDGVMRLEGEMPGPGATTVRHRLSWRRTGDGRVRQLWERSTDDGRSWVVVFEGLYARVQ